MIRRLSGIAWQIALAALLVAGIAIAILVVGVLIVGAQSFADLMAEHGESTEASREMFVDSVGWVVVGTIIVAVAVAVAVASLLGARLAMPLREIGRAARQIAAGDYRARIPRTGPRRSSAWRTRSTRWRPRSTNRSGCGASSSPTPRMSFGPPHQPAGLPGALRDGVIEPDPATFESLLEESERLVRLSRSLDTLAAGDAGTRPRPSTSTSRG